MTRCLIGMGSNLGSRRETLETSVARLLEHKEIHLVARSSWHIYPAIGGPPGQGDFLNGALLIETDLPPASLVKSLHAVEHSLGRARVERWAARTLDCDLLLYGDQQLDTAELQVPHPRMITRRFVLEPAAEIAAKMVHPGLGWTIERLLRHLNSATPYFAVTGSQRAMAVGLARELAHHVTGRLITGGTAVPSDSSSLDWNRRLEFAQRLGRLLRQHGLVEGVEGFPDASPRVSDFWCWQPLLVGAAVDRNWKVRIRELQAHASTMSPKLLIVTDPISSAFGKSLRSLDAGQRVPTLHVSRDPQEALQDAVGAVLAMR